MQPGSKETAEQTQPPAFLAAAAFEGAKEGYVFTTGEQGTGYYTDSPLHLRHKSAAAAAKKPPAVLKSSSIVKGLRKPAALPAAKKQKTDSSGPKPAYLKEMERYNAMNCSSDTQHDRPLVK